MDDRGEKIVTLAKAMLRSEPNVSNMLSHQNRTDSPLRALCLTAVISALGGSVAATTYQETSRPITYYEKVEIDALVFYASQQNSVDENTIKNELKFVLSIDTPSSMTNADFVRAREYLRKRIP